MVLFGFASVVCVRLLVVDRGSRLLLCLPFFLVIRLLMLLLPIFKAQLRALKHRTQKCRSLNDGSEERMELLVVGGILSCQVVKHFSHTSLALYRYQFAALSSKLYVDSESKQTKHELSPRVFVCKCLPQYNRRVTELAKEPSR
ncbi:hypothetical protein AUEXF2481DRAFT_225141 [Aureobasidium subglaciale EXF-2481]|uniref:Uncharacterized protein n=1 Tax=Aureobasidium subglaciale (strain EXF-2481) TaxID=1043005 RepID=A0A074Z7N4_AURSE|nr:uncharacterized protein AUEXF2481DRAFT_225141 [Aureobasidium subglaciale EXF-2481]KEQ94896.1 hypothetical protein AUEXF2481DRAFT_225141 [Aureobasidium subglaciale EXF-2481]